VKPEGGEDLGDLYDVRFSETERRAKERVWRVLCEQFFQQFVPEGAVVLDLACGFGEFSRFVRAGRKLALDSNPRVASLLPEDVEFVLGSAQDLSEIDAEAIDVCFTSNFFEHLPDRASMDRVLREVYRVLRPGGAFVAMQPNIKYAGNAYWDFYDHVLPLSHLSAREAFLKSRYRVERLIPRFVPFSTKSAYPKHPALVSLYLKLPFLWRLLGKQFVVVARKPGAAPTWDS
jgi:ubiquinone/menaquinone biosynthesis C-methylase UbiE